MNHTTRRLLGIPVTLLLAGLLLGACSPSPTSPEATAPPPQPSATSTALPRPTTVPVPTPPPTATPLPTVPPTPSPNPTKLPVPTQTPPSALPSIRLEGAGSTYATLEEAVAAAAPGETLLLGAGSYRLAEPLLITRSIRLVGLGISLTEILSEGEGYGVRFEGAGPFAAEDISFHHQGDARADVVVVQGGEIAFARCRFSGAVWLGEGEWPAGLRLQGDTTGTVEDCIAIGNANVGISVQDQAQPRLEGNDCSYANLIGIEILGEARPTLEGNSCLSNGLVGISYGGDAGGVARENECSGNVNGFIVAGRAQPSLEENTCTGNSRAGIWYLGQAGGLARGNTCSENGEGIVVGEQAQPTLEENICRDNGWNGIYYTETAGGLARQNECAGNQVGIFVEETANPELVDNNCHDNQEDIRDLRP